MTAIERSGLPVVWKERAFDGAVHRKVLPPTVRMPTIAEIVGGIPQDELPRGFREHGEVRINGELVPRGLWHLVRPKYNAACDTVVSLHVPLRGGGGSSGGDGGGKSILRTVATIAVLLVAAAVSGGALGALGGGLFAAGTVGASVAGAAIGLVGSLAVAALIPPPQPAVAQSSTSSAVSQGTGSSAASNELVATSLSGNVLSPGDSVPRVVGTMRLFPPLFCNPLIEVVGNVQVGEAVFGLCGPHAITDIHVGGVDVNSMSGVSVQIVEGKPGDAIQSLVRRQSVTVNANAQLIPHKTNATTQVQLLDQSNPPANVPQPQTVVSRKAPDEIWITLQWGQGLIYGLDTTQVINQAVRLQIRQKGSASWVNLPEIHFSMNQIGGFEKVVRLKWGAFPVAPNPPPSNQGPVYVYRGVPGQSAVSPATTGWTSHSSFSTGTGSDLLSAATFGTSSGVKNTELYADKVIFYLDPAVFPQDYYEVQVVQSCAYKAASFTAASYAYSGVVYDLFGYWSNAGVYQLPVDPTNINSSISVSRVSSVWNQNPVQSADFATVSVKVQGRALDQLSVLASGYVNDWDGSDWADFTTTSNPAPHFRDVLTGNLGSEPVDTDLVNDDELLEWRDDCIDKGYTCNAVIERNTYIDALKLIATSGYANLRQNEKWGVFQDKDLTAVAPVQIFNPRNMANFRWTRAFAKAASGLRVSYVNADNDYNADTPIIYADPANQDADNLAQVTYYGLVNEADVIKRARFDMKQAKLRFTFYSGDAWLESLVCQRGDLVGVQHDILKRQAGFSRISDIQRAGGNVTGLVLDGSVPVFSSAGLFATAHLFPTPHVFDLGRKTGVAIRLKSGAGVLVKQVTAASDGDNTVLSFATPFADPGATLDVDCLVSAGPLGSEYKRLIVFGVAPKDDLAATITFVDEAPELWS